MTYDFDPRTKFQPNFKPDFGRILTKIFFLGTASSDPGFVGAGKAGTAATATRSDDAWWSRSWERGSWRYRYRSIARRYYDRAAETDGGARNARTSVATSPGGDSPAERSSDGRSRG